MHSTPGVPYRGLDMCPQTQTRLTSSKLETDPELKRRVLAWLKVDPVSAVPKTPA